MRCPWCGVETRPIFSNCLECGRDVHRGPPPPTVLDAGTPPFSRSAACSLARRRHDGTLWYTGLDGLLAASVAEAADGTLRCRSLAGDDVFAVGRYAPGGTGSLVVTDPGDGGRPIGTYVVDDAVPPRIVVRDDASAPVGHLHGSPAALRFTETGGGTVARVRRDTVELPEAWTDDRWTLAVDREPATLDRRALVAALVVCRVLYSTAPRRPEED